MPTDPPDRLAAIQARAEAATKGPWTPYDNHVQIGSFLNEIETENPMVGDSSADTHFIAHAREDIPYLLALVQAQAEENTELKRRLNQWEPKISVDIGGT